MTHRQSIVADHSRFIILAITFCVTSTVHADAWVDKMLEHRELDFGIVKHGEDIVRRTQIRNPYKHPIELLSVRSSCGCTSASLQEGTLDAGEVSDIVVTLNTRSHNGPQEATLTLEARWVDHGIQRVGESSIEVKGVIEHDVTVEPHSIEFERVTVGLPHQRKLSVSSDGSKHWKIAEVQHGSHNVNVSFCETCRTPNRIAYDLMVQLASHTPVGSINEKLFVITEGQLNKTIPIAVSGVVTEALNVSPENIFLGKVAPNEHVRRRFVLRCTKPVVIQKVVGSSKRMLFDFDGWAAKRHIIEMRVIGDQTIGSFEQTVRIETDAGEASPLTVHGEIVGNSTSR
jgi:hypothetical protein